MRKSNSGLLTKLLIFAVRSFGLLAIVLSAFAAHGQEVNSQMMRIDAHNKMELLTEEGSSNSFIIHYSYKPDGTFLEKKAIYHGPVDMFFATEQNPVPAWLNTQIKYKRSSGDLVVVIGGKPFLISTQNKFIALPENVLQGFLAPGFFDYAFRFVRQALPNDVILDGLLGVVYDSDSQHYIEVDTNLGRSAWVQISNDLNASEIRISHEGGLRVLDSARKVTHEIPLSEFTIPSHDQTAVALSKLAANGKKFTVSADKLSNQQVQQEIVRYESFLRARIIEQDDVIQGLVNLRKRSLYFGSDPLGENISLLGLPGTGKDTTAESDIDALNNQVGAHNEHLFRTPIIRSTADLNILTGSQTGYVGSDELPPIVRFVVLHSGGEYQIVTPDRAAAGGAKNWVIRNPNWKEGDVLPGYFSPAKAGIFVNEVHDWDRIGLNGFFKEFAEKGIVPISNAGPGLPRLVFRGRKYIASNDLVQLCSSLEPDGKRFGSGPMSYDDMLAMWDKVHNDKKKMIEALRAAEGADKKPRYSPEVINRLSPSLLFLMKPLSPKGLQQIIKIRLASLFDRIQKSPKEFPGQNGNVEKISFSATPALIEYVQKHDYVAEEMARPLKDKTTVLVEDPLLEALHKGLLKTDGTPTQIVLDIRENENKTANLILITPALIGSGEQAREISIPIEATQKNASAQAMSVEQLQKLKQIKSELAKHVFGADEVLDRVSAALLNIEDQKNGPDAGGATTFLFAGLTSTGKTEVAKAIGRVYLNDENAVHVADFSNIRTEQDMDKAILDIGKSLDRGKKIILLDEIVNSNPEFLKRLYPLLREKEMQFPDGRRSLKGVLVVMTGNLGSEWFQGVPTSIPRYQKLMAYRNIFRAMVNDQGAIQKTLRKAGLTDAFIARIGSNVFFFDPHYFKSIRQLTQNKLKFALQSLKPKTGTWGWNVQFASVEDLQKTIEGLEDEGFIVEQQGASIDNYVRDGFAKRLRDLLLTNEVPNGSTVTLSNVIQIDETRGERKYVLSSIYVMTEKGPLNFKTQGRLQEVTVPERQSDEILTAMHEAAHSMARQALFPGRVKPIRISTVPGVAQLGRDEEFISYLGIASSQPTEQTPLQRSVVIRHMAVLLAGEVAQTLTTRGTKHDAGKGSDTERASQLAQSAILRWGLSPKWGRVAIPQGMTMSDYLATLSDRQKDLYASEMNQMFIEAREVARSILLVNYDKVLIPLGNELAEKRDMNEADLDAFYAAHPVVTEQDAGVMATLKSLSISSLSARFSKYFPSKDPISAELMPGIRVPEKMKSIDTIIHAEKAKQLAGVSLDPELPVAPSSHAHTRLTCESLFNH